MAANDYSMLKDDMSGEPHPLVHPARGCTECMPSRFLVNDDGTPCETTRSFRYLDRVHHPAGRPHSRLWQPDLTIPIESHQRDLHFPYALPERPIPE